MRNPLQPFIGELEIREARLAGTLEKLEEAEIDPGYSNVLEAEIDELYAEMLSLEDRLGGLHAAVVAAADGRLAATVNAARAASHQSGRSRWPAGP
jgi:hypothetical protein